MINTAPAISNFKWSSPISFPAEKTREIKRFQNKKAHPEPHNEMAIQYDVAELFGLSALATAPL